MNTINSTVNEVHNVLDTYINHNDVNLDAPGGMTAHSKVKKKQIIAKFRREKMGLIESLFS